MSNDHEGKGGGESAPNVAGPAGPAAETGLIPAATVIPLRQSPAGMEVLLLQRNSRGQFGNMWVFPGGRVDLDDFASLVGDEAEVELGAARAAAVREAAEEASLALVPSSLVPLSFWVPPLGGPKRFATWFFLVEVPNDGSAVVVDQLEIHRSEWITPAKAIARVNAAEMNMAPPTFATLWWLRDQTDTQGARAAVQSRQPERFSTHMRADGGVLTALWEGDVAYDDGDMDQAGPRRRLIMDPGSWRIEMHS
jgi:8-oxo-dGTP pyrophosphatase MutT (NUDIX family)